MMKCAINMLQINIKNSVVLLISFPLRGQSATTCLHLYYRNQFL